MFPPWQSAIQSACTSSVSSTPSEGLWRKSLFSLDEWLKITCRFDTYSKTISSKGIIRFFIKTPPLCMVQKHILCLCTINAARRLFLTGFLNFLLFWQFAQRNIACHFQQIFLTCKLVKLGSCRYLLWVLRSAPVLSQSNESWAENLLPANAPQECLVPQ